MTFSRLATLNLLKTTMKSIKRGLFTIKTSLTLDLTMKDHSFSMMLIPKSKMTLPTLSMIRVYKKKLKSQFRLKCESLLS